MKIQGAFLMIEISEEFHIIPSQKRLHSNDIITVMSLTKFWRIIPKLLRDIVQSYQFVAEQRNSQKTIQERHSVDSTWKVQ